MEYLSPVRMAHVILRVFQDIEYESSGVLVV